MISSAIFFIANGFVIFAALALIAGVLALTGIIRFSTVMKGDAQYLSNRLFKIGGYALLAGVPMWIIAQVVKLIEHVLGAFIGAVL